MATPASRAPRTRVGRPAVTAGPTLVRPTSQEEPDIPDALRLATAKGLECDIDLDGSTYFLSRATIL